MDSILLRAKFGGSSGALRFLHHTVTQAAVGFNGYVPPLRQIPKFSEPILSEFK